MNIKDGIFSNKTIKWESPTPEMMKTPEFNAIWECIKTWDINVPEVYDGYCGANDNHVVLILDALYKLKDLQDTERKIKKIKNVGI